MIITDNQYEQLAQYELDNYYEKVEKYLKEHLPEKVILFKKDKIRNEIVNAVKLGLEFGFLSESDNAYFLYFFFLLTKEQENLKNDPVIADPKLSPDQKFKYIKSNYLGL
jgi:hypothetical protein